MKSQNNAFIITLTGPSMSGKSYVIDRIMELEEKLYSKKKIIFHPIKISKYTTRSYRIEEIENMLKGKTVDVKSCDIIPYYCDLRYQTYGKQYGLSSKSIRDNLQCGNSPIIIINDVRVVEELKKCFPKSVLALFLFREIPKLSSYEKIASERGNSSVNETMDRFNKATAIYRTYIENIALFDRVILNPSRSNNLYDYAQIQIENVILGVLNGKIKLDAKKKNEPKLFIISGNAASGKDEIIQAVNEMGKLQAHIIPKYTSRMQDETDRDEMICQYIPKKELLDKYKIEYMQELKEKEYDFKLREDEAAGDADKLVKVRAEILEEKRKIKNEFQRFWYAVMEYKKAQCEYLRKHILNEASTRHQLSSLDLFNKSYEELCDIYRMDGYHKRSINIEQFFLDNPNLNEQDLVNLISDEAEPEVDLCYDKIKNLKEKELWKLYEKEGYHSDNVNIASLKEDFSQKFMDKFYMKNPKYIIDLEKIHKEQQQYIKRKIKNQDMGMTGPAYYIDYENKGWVMYENNQTLYAFDVCEIIDKKLTKPFRYYIMKEEDKHCVLVASLIGIFSICKKWFKNHVVTVFAYSEISSEEFEKNSKAGTVDKKMASFEKEIYKYSKYIVDYDHVTIYAESELERKSGGRTEELIDQIFRLFRYYS